MATTLIDRDYALLQLRMGELENCGVFETDSAHIKDFLNALPNVDAMEVVHGRWVNPYMNRYGHPCHCCSICGFKASSQDKNYCPNCGAKMDLK